MKLIGCGRKFYFSLVFLIILVLVASSVHASEVIQVVIDKNVYPPGGDIEVSGIVYSGTDVAPNFQVNITVFNSTNSSISVNTTNTNNNGTFSAIVKAPNVEGDYNINVSSGDATTTLSFSVSQVSDVMVVLVNPPDTLPSVIVVPLNANKQVVGIASLDEEINTSNARYGNFSFNGTLWYLAVEKDETGKYAFVHIDDDNVLWFNNSDATGIPIYKNLEEGSKLKLGDRKFEVVYIDPLGSEVILANKAPSKFEGTGNETFDVLAVAINSSGAPVSGAELTMKIYDDKGTLINISLPKTTGNNGTVIFENNQVGTTGGVFNVVVNEIGRVSYVIETFNFVVSLKTPEGNPAYEVEPGANLSLVAAVLNKSTNLPIRENIPMNITIIGPAHVKATLILVNGSLSTNISAPATRGEYNIEFAVIYHGVVAKRNMKLLVKSYDLFAFPIAKNKGPSQGFAPSEQGAIFVGIADMGTGELLNLSDLTNNCLNISLSGIFDSEGNNFFNGTYNKTNLTEFFTFLENQGEAPPEEIKDKLRNEFGEGACVLLFTAPNETGIYQAEISANVSGIEESTVTTLSVQEVFVFAYPASTEEGAFTFAFSPGSTIYLVINAYDPVSGSNIDPSKILDASIIEVYSEEGGVVTDKMVNENFIDAATSKSGLAMLSFIANDSYMGDHFVRFMVRANVTRNGVEKTVEAIGDGWFQTRLYNVWAYPADGRGIYGSNSNVTMTIEVTDASGRIPKSGVIVSLSEVRNTMTWEKVAGVSVSTPTSSTASYCTTNTNGTCILTLHPPSGGWDSGVYDVKFRIRDTLPDGTEITDYGYGWFEVRSFNFWAWTSNWEVAIDKEVNISVDISDFEGNPITAEVTIDKLLYMGTFENWRPPTVVNDSIGVSAIISGNGNIILPAGTVSQEGMYAVRLKAYNATYGTEVTEAWFYARAFILWADVEDQETWPPKFGLNEQAKVRVQGFDNITSWWPIQGAPHNITAAWISSISRVGEWETTFKTRSQMFSENNLTYACDGNICNITFNLSGFVQGEYIATIVANDSSGAEASTWFFFRVEQLGIGIPQLMDWWYVDEGNVAENRTNFRVNETCGSASFSVGKPSDVADTNCYCIDKRILDINQITTFDSYKYNTTYFLFDRNSTNPRLFINTTAGEDATFVNFSNASYYTEGDIFTDAAGYRWKITELDPATGDVYLQAVDGVIGRDPWNNETFLFIVNQSLSKSGKFLYSGEPARDNDWLKIDLDGDGDYYNDEYFMLLADSQTAGKYDTVLISPTTNMSEGDDTQDEAIQLAQNASPIYLLNIRYSAISSQYVPVFTSNKISDWPGMNLGTYKAGSVIKIPVIVTSPSNSSIFKNATVNVTALIRMGSFTMERIPITGASAVTNKTGKPGVAIIKVNTSGLDLSGLYKVEIQALDLDLPASQATWVKMPNVWEYPEIEIRNFEVHTMPGRLGKITGIKIMNVDVLDSAELLGGFMAGMSLYQAPDVLNISFDYPYNRQIYYNRASDLVLVDWDMDGDISNAIEYDYTTELIPIRKEYNTTEFINVTIIKDTDVHKTVIYLDEKGYGNAMDNFVNFTVYSVNTTATPPYVNIKMEILQPWGPCVVYQDYANESDTLLKDSFNITEITDDNVTIRWDGWFLIANSTLDIEGDFRIARLVNVSDDYELIIYNNKKYKTARDLESWNTFKELPDVVRVIYTSNGSMVKEYKIGQIIQEIGKAVVGGAEKWNEKVYLSDFTIKGKTVYPIPWWSCDAPVYYIGNFTEQSASIDVNMDWEYNDTPEYYVLFYDGTCDGISKPTMKIVDDDTIFDMSWSEYGPWDYYGNETGELEWAGTNFSERESRLKDSWPFTVIELNVSDPNNGTAISFSEKRDVTPGMKLTILITAKDFDGMPIDGNATLEKLTRMEWGEFGPIEADATPSPAPFTDVINGIGYLNINTTSLEDGDYIAKIKVASQDGTTETVEEFFHVGAFEGGPGPGGGF